MCHIFLGVGYYFALRFLSIQLTGCDVRDTPAGGFLYRTCEAPFCVCCSHISVWVSLLVSVGAAFPVCYNFVGSTVTCRIRRFLRLLPLPLLSLINIFVLFENRRSPLEFSTARKFPYRRLKTTWRRRGSRLGEPREVKRW